MFNEPLVTNNINFYSFNNLGVLKKIFTELVTSNYVGFELNILKKFI
jgi:hypothetical protein